MINDKQLEIIFNKLRKKGHTFEDGLNENEFQEIEKSFGFVFPPDLRCFLSKQLPTSDDFVNWRLTLTSPEYKKEIDERMDWPMNGLLHCVKNGFFWMEDWGTKPATFEEQKEIVHSAFQDYPRMILIYSHRYIPEVPNESGNPVFSVHQSDTIYYGTDLWSYLEHEFTLKVPRSVKKRSEPKRIHFWSELVDLNNLYFNP